MFRPLGDLSELVHREEEILEFWRERSITQKSLRQREENPSFIFYEGPPTTNGYPHAGHAIGRSIKDLIPRYKTMCGYFVPRKAGWDAHGLPVELEVEKQLGFSGKQDIERYGIEQFNIRCRESVFKYIQQWRAFSERLGIWMDYEHPYVTCENEYIESTWWILKSLWEKGLLYQGFKVLPFCVRCGTSLSSHEVALGYRETDDPSIYVLFPLQNQPDTSFLVWTTTPWTLAANVALAVAAESTYIEVENKKSGQRLILSRERFSHLLEIAEWNVLREYRGRELAGLYYEPIMSFTLSEEGYKVFTADFVSLDEGTGIVHIAPAFGEDDMDLAREKNLPVIKPVLPDGTYQAGVGTWGGMWVKDADPLIIEYLKGVNKLFRRETHRHTYPFCWRCDTELLYYAKESWFVKSTAIKNLLVETNHKIDWFPEHIKNGRFGNFLENVVDWALSRERYWGTPLNIWQCRQCGHQDAIGSTQELQERSQQKWEYIELHRPYVDRVTLTCPLCSGTMNRVPEVIDCWFDSGAMFVSQLHYPFKNQDVFRRFFPADFICEAIDQTRGWFYSLHILAVALFGESSYRQCLVTELGLDERGQKMSKHVGNVINPWDLMNEYGADVLRWYVFSVSPPWVAKRFGKRVLADVYRKFFNTLWNTFDFFVLYASIDRFSLDTPVLPLSERSDLDRWLISCFESLVDEVRRFIDSYEISRAAKAIEGFVIEDCSNWYIRRSRKRFWQSGMNNDKIGAYWTVYEILRGLVPLLAPFVPFFSEIMYRNLMDGSPEAKESVHLENYPEFHPERVDRQLLCSMDIIRKLTILGRAVRNKTNLKTRQPLRRAILVVPDDQEQIVAKRFVSLIQEELNVKEVEWTASLPAGIRVVLKPVFSVLGPRFGQNVKRIAKLLTGFDQGLAVTFLRTGTVELELDGELILLERGDIDPILTTERGDLSVESAEGYAVVLDTEMDNALLREGMVRELIHLIQTFRKEAGFQVEDRISIHFAPENDDDLRCLMEEYRDFVQSETMARKLSFNPAHNQAFTRECIVGDKKIRISLER
ncbi:MAG TPA: isoleucine--tRNA ligase [Atribacteraceae bacterium]|nr:isoleucine--tRNA ligase [Atribacteraceae bacterium]